MGAVHAYDVWCGGMGTWCGVAWGGGGGGGVVGAGAVGARSGRCPAGGGGSGGPQRRIGDQPFPHHMHWGPALPTSDALGTSPSHIRCTPGAPPYVSPVAPPSCPMAPHAEEERPVGVRTGAGGLPDYIVVGRRARAGRRARVGVGRFSPCPPACLSPAPLPRYSTICRVTKKLFPPFEAGMVDDGGQRQR